MKQVAQIRLTGEGEMLSELVARLNAASIPGVSIALEAARAGRKGEHLSYGTVSLDTGRDQQTSASSSSPLEK
jgi:hypothetical protein